MKRLIKGALGRLGIYYAKRQYMPCGIDWLWDVCRLSRGLPMRTVFDVGANVGQTTRLIKGRFASADVHAFEPVSATYRSLAHNLRDLEGVTCHRLAFCERIGQSAVTMAGNSQLNRLVSEAEARGRSDTETIDTETIDHFCATRGIRTVDILKVDAEGADLRVLQGGLVMLQQGQIAFVFVEVGFDEDDSGHSYFPAVHDLLTKAGMRLYCVYDYYHEDEGRKLVFANALYLSPSALGRAG